MIPYDMHIISIIRLPVMFSFKLCLTLGHAVSQHDTCLLSEQFDTETHRHARAPENITDHFLRLVSFPRIPG